MKSKDLIKLLQKEDPTGETHIRINGSGDILCLEMKPGYYDGPYAYKNEKGQLVFTDKEHKLDIYIEDLTDIIWKYNGDMKKIKEKIVLDYKNRRNDGFWKHVEKEANEAKEFHEGLELRMMKDVLEKINDGYEIWQSEEDPIGRYNVMKWWKNGLIYNKQGFVEKLRQGDCTVVLKSGLFFHVRSHIHKGYFWRLKKDVESPCANDDRKK